MKYINLLGATGSIGTQVLEVVSSLSDEFTVRAISVGHNSIKAEQIIEKYHPEYVSFIDKEVAEKFAKKYSNIKFGYGENGLIQCAIYKSNDKDVYVVNAVVGMIGLKPTIEAIKASKTVLLANKETLVVGGEIIMPLVKQYKAKLIPIDSEHSAIMQCLEGRKNKEISRIIITASGGIFRDKTRAELENVTAEDATHHPNWAMGKKITVDCATMVNKALEVMEAHYLFNCSYDKITALIHRQSIIHSAVEFVDGVIMAQMAKPDMRIPIQNALTYPDKLPFKLNTRMNLEDIVSLTFETLDYKKYPCFKMGLDCAKMGGIMPTVYNASNEIANSLFLSNKIKYLDIENIIKIAIEEYKDKNLHDFKLDDIIRIDNEVREFVRKRIK